MSQLLTAAEAAILLRLDVRRIQTLARLGRLPAVRTGRKWLFDRSALLGLLATAPGPATASSEPVPPKSVAVFEADKDESELGVDISARNQLRGVVREIIVDGLMAEVRISIGDQDLVSVITRRSAERLGIREGSAVLAVIKSTEIMVARRMTYEPDHAASSARGGRSRST